MHLSYPSHSNRRNSERSSQLAEKTHTPFSIPHNIRFEYFVTSPETEKTTGVTKDIAEDWSSTGNVRSSCHRVIRFGVLLFPSLLGLNSEV
ncbi:hypothetical protein HanHA300_Chr02g0053251 [Helianthus annuus]|nr:hypothetical protein HanHA300_Chr02g0053251 [Helianthus annuus]